MTTWQVSDLLEYFGQEQACYTALLDLSRRQHAVIQTGDTDELFRILGRKQSVLDDLQRIEEKLRPFKENWQAVRASLDESRRQVLQVALSTVEELLADLIAVERESEDLLHQGREETRQQLRESMKVQSAVHAYSTKTDRDEPRILDIQES